MFSQYHPDFDCFFWQKWINIYSLKDLHLEVNQDITQYLINYQASLALDEVFTVNEEDPMECCYATVYL